VKSDVRVCSAWREEHERPVYALSETCPRCGAATENSAPAPFDPADPYGEYRRRAKRRRAADDRGSGPGPGPGPDTGDDATDAE
jgi:H/ACA ribonucleoprotein complex subunit 3